MVMAALFALDVALVLAFAYFLATAFRPPTRPAFLTSLFVLVWVDLVLTAEILSLLHLLTAWGMAAGHLILGAAAFLVWQAAGRPRHPRFSLPSRPEWLESLKSWPDLWTLGLAVGLAYAFLAVINLLVPPNNMDSMAYHLTRVAYWIQHHSLAPWQSRSLAQTAFPLNAEIGSLWSMLFLRRDLLTGFVQWSSALAAATAVFGLARGFGASRPQAAFASSVYLTLPMIVLQSTTTQNDLAAAAMFAVLAYLFLLGLKTKHRGMLILSGAALGLVMGMKLTAPMIGPGFVLAAAYVTLTRRPRPFRLLLVWAGACLAGFVLLGAFNYVQSWLFYGHPLGDERIIDKQLGEMSAGDITLIRSNVACDVFGFMDFSGIPGPAARLGVRARKDLGQTVFHALRVPFDDKTLNARGHQFSFRVREPVASEAGSFFGPLGFFLILPLVLYWVVRGLITRDERLILALSFLGFMLVIGGSQAWIPFRGRFYCAAVTLVAPLASPLFGRGIGRAVIRAVIGIIAATTLIVTLLTNVQKPLIGQDAIWGKSRAELRMAEGQRTSFPNRAIERWIPPEAKVATILQYKDPEYILFGEGLTRTLVQVLPAPPTVDLDWLHKNPYDYVVVHALDFCPVTELPAGEFRVLFHPPFKIIIRNKAGS